METQKGRGMFSASITLIFFKSRLWDILMCSWISVYLDEKMAIHLHFLHCTLFRT